MNTSHIVLGLSKFAQSSLQRGWGRLYLLLFTLPTMAQTPSDSLMVEAEYRFASLTQLWHNTNTLQDYLLMIPQTEDLHP